MARKSIYALVIAAVAAPAFALGTAYAAGSDKPPKPAKGVHFAVVKSDATFHAHSKDVQTVEGPFTGSRYLIGFKDDVTKCALVAVQGAFSGGDAPTTAGHVTVGPHGDVQHINVRTFDAAGNAADRSFHLIVAC
jgi:hypothetical protein